MSDQTPKSYKLPPDLSDNEAQQSNEVQQSAEDFVKFLKNSANKEAFKNLMIETFQEMEAQRLNELKGRMANEQKVDSQKIEDFHTPGNIATLLSETLTMNETEHAFTRALKATKNNMVRAVETRVEEINRLLADIGGFSSQLRGCFARSTVVFLEQEDHERPFREKILFSINMPNYELKTSWEKGKNTKGSDGRSELRTTWDEAVNVLAQIIASTGLKPKYCKNDRNYGRFVMTQDLRHPSNLPDEYFSFTLDYNTREKIDDMIPVFNKLLEGYNKRCHKLEKKLMKYPQSDRSPHYLKLRKKYLQLAGERDYFLATVPDPNQLDEGLLFLIEVSTLKDYHVVKDRMQSIMTRYILHLSKIAMNESELAQDLEIEMMNKKSQENKNIEKELEDVQEYTVDAAFLQPVKKKAA